VKTKKEIVDDFHTLWYNQSEETWKSLRWLGFNIQKTPCDLLIYQEIIFQLRPDIIIECGTAFGGSALFMASICDLVGNGRIITIDVDTKPVRPSHPRIQYVAGSSVDPSRISELRTMISPDEKVMVVLDSAHHMSHVLAELRAYAPLVTEGSYLIVEDGNLNGHPVMKASGPGPLEAIEEFLREQDAFEVDASKERLMFTFNPSGYLKKKPAMPVEK